MDIVSVTRRLNLIKNFALLGEHDEIPAQVDKLRPFSDTHNLSEILDALSESRFEESLEKIEQFCADKQAVVAFSDPDIEALRLELKTLETQLLALSEEKAEIERQIIEFSAEHTSALGGLLTEYLRLRKEKLERERKQSSDAESEYQEAREEFETYSEEFEAAKKKSHIPELSDEEQAELTALYRMASQLCHPDKVGEDDKEEAHKIFVELNEAYQANDIGRVKSILEQLRGQAPFVFQAETLDDKQVLKKEISKLRMRIEEIRQEIAALEASETFKTLSSLENWYQYFEDQKLKLGVEIESLKKELALE
jgi:hypothetical protein